MTLLVRYLRPLWGQVALLTVLLLGGLGLQLAQPQIMRAFLDTALARGSLEVLTEIALLYLGAALLGQGLAVVESYAAESLAWAATNRLRVDLVAHCLSLDMPFHNARTPGELIERVDGDVAQLSNFFARFSVQLLGSALLFAGILVLLFAVHWEVGAAGLASAVVSMEGRASRGARGSGGAGPRPLLPLLTQYRQAGVSAERLAALLAGAPPGELVRRRPVHLRGSLPEVELAAKTAADRLEVLSAAGLTYRYPESGRGVVDVSLRLSRGSFTVVTGRIGAGKTTLLRALLGLLPRQAGEISWNGSPVADAASFLVPPRVAYTPQVPQLFSESLADNILMGLPESRVDLPASLHLAVLEGDVGALDQGLATLVGPRGVKLSGGQRQRTAAARMLVRDAELLVFDDLSSALDVETERRLWQRIFARPDLTCLVVSHRRAVLRHADRVIVLAGGRAVAEGTLAELLESSEEMRQLWSADEDGGSWAARSGTYVCPPDS